VPFVLIVIPEEKTRTMSNIENKARYFFGDKPVIERAEDEDEFEGSILKEEDLQVIAKINSLGLSNFWKEIWIELVSLRCEVILDECCSETYFILQDVSTLARSKYPFGSAQDPFWCDNVNSANKKGWGWSGDTDIYVKQLIGPKSLAEAVLSLLIAEPTNFHMGLNGMGADPSETSYNSWKAFWNYACNDYEQDLPEWKGTRPERGLVLQSDGNTKITVAQKSSTTFIVVYFFTS
jgi:hypothetical protein